MRTVEVQDLYRFELSPPAGIPVFSSVDMWTIGVSRSHRTLQSSIACSMWSKNARNDSQLIYVAFVIGIHKIGM
jgi:hypothetical protein